MEIQDNISEVLTEIRQLNPSLRFGQLVVNISYLAKGWTKSAAWDVEDDEFLTAAASYLEDLKRLDADAFDAPASHIQKQQKEAVPA